MQVILDSLFARPGSAPIWGGKKGSSGTGLMDFHVRYWVYPFHEMGAFKSNEWLRKSRHDVIVGGEAKSLCRVRQ